MNSDPNAHTDTRPYRLDRLKQLHKAWTAAEQQPLMASHLPPSEFSALVLACGHDQLLPDTLGAFFALEGWLQRWVLERRELSDYIGVVVGDLRTDPFGM